MDEIKGLKLSIKKTPDQKTTFMVKDIEVGKDFLIIAGPCSVESEKQIADTALAVKRSGANILRGGAYKPRTSPYSFQGLKDEGLEYLKAAGEAAGLPVLTEVMDTRDVDKVARYADILQVGARNMQNFPLLVELGKTNKPVMLKRGIQATIEEWLDSAEYIISSGNPNVILCERGIRTVETYTRNTLDISAIAAIKRISPLPVVADPSHATGRKELVFPMCMSAMVAGCDGLMVEVHPFAGSALSDSKQQLSFEEFDGLADGITKMLGVRNDFIK